MNDKESGKVPVGIAELLAKEAAEKKAEDYADWCDQMAGVDRSFELHPKSGFLIDHEFQPIRWMSDGLDVLSSARGATMISDLSQSHPVFWQAYLPYAVFQMGTELFLKGMWLCQYADCRHLDHFDHLSPSRRQEISKALKGLGHDLFGLIGAIRMISEYQSFPPSLRFLEIVEGVTRFFYYPVWKTADRDWASSRYPKRFYDDAQSKGGSDALKSYPEHWLIVKLFRDAENSIDHLWGLRRGLGKQLPQQGSVGPSR